uniref:hypothetical protein n=1 Tax=Micromonospora sp. TaxID=1876 RepID=UPI003B3A7C07
DLAAVRSAAAQASWSTGPVAPGVTQGWVWNNANPLNAAYQVGLSPTGAGEAHAEPPAGGTGQSHRWDSFRVGSGL